MRARLRESRLLAFSGCSGQSSTITDKPALCICHDRETVKCSYSEVKSSKLRPSLMYPNMLRPTQQAMLLSLAGSDGILFIAALHLFIPAPRDPTDGSYMTAHQFDRSGEFRNNSLIGDREMDLRETRSCII